MDVGDGVREVRITGTLALTAGAALWKALRVASADEKAKTVRFEMSGVESADGGAVALLVQTKWDLEKGGATCAFVGARDKVAKILELYGETNPGEQRPADEPQRVLAQIGQASFDALLEVKVVLAFLGSLVLAVLGIARKPGTGNWRELPGLANRTGSDAVPIVLLINFLLGLILAFQCSAELREFGANVYVADLVGLSIARELGPLMTAIIVCGRSGAAFAAELGTMKVSEEVDALQTMGFGPLRYLVVPRVLALLLVTPILTLLGDAIGFLGGLLIAVLTLDMTPRGYLIETVKAVHIWDFTQGLVKSAAFGIAIALIACQQGLATSGGAEGVGRRTTSAVVITLFMIILLDACFTMLFHAFQR